ncbi:hypothetical protein [Halovenus aranensis]|jgi:hypothetical protein|uniref:hypothetical protein n=1 Tax=Halovenus aranensis TaxID=890420 RepID=UPI000B837AC7|nr:hypothetical protein [Halovenus aranensis]
MVRRAVAGLVVLCGGAVALVLAGDTVPARLVDVFWTVVFWLLVAAVLVALAWSVFPTRSR